MLSPMVQSCWPDPSKTSSPAILHHPWRSIRLSPESPQKKACLSRYKAKCLCTSYFCSSELKWVMQFVSQQFWFGNETPSICAWGALVSSCWKRLTQWPVGVHGEIEFEMAFVANWIFGGAVHPADIASFTFRTWAEFWEEGSLSEANLRCSIMGGTASNQSASTASSTFNSEDTAEGPAYLHFIVCSPEADHVVPRKYTPTKCNTYRFQVHLLVSNYHSNSGSYWKEMLLHSSPPICDNIYEIRWSLHFATESQSCLLRTWHS